MNADPSRAFLVPPNKKRNAGTMNRTVAAACNANANHRKTERRDNIKTSHDDSGQFDLPRAEI